MNFNNKSLAFALVGFSVLLLIILTFVKIDVDEQSTVLCQTYEKANLDMTTCPAHQSNFSWMILLAFGIAFFLLALGVYFWFAPQHAMSAVSVETSKTFKTVDVSKFDDEEKKVYEFLKQSNGSVYQTDIVKETGWSKVKITRVLDKLESKDVLERRRRGMANIIVLK